jgi:hypothetical protein
MHEHDDDLAGADAALADMGGYPPCENPYGRTETVRRDGRVYTRVVLAPVYEPTPKVIAGVRWSRAWAGRTDAGTIPA